MAQAPQLSNSCSPCCRYFRDGIHNLEIPPRKGEGILGLTYQMKGNIAEPTILVNPLSMFTPGILRRIFEFGAPKPPLAANPQANAPASR